MDALDAGVGVGAGIGEAILNLIPYSEASKSLLLGGLGVFIIHHLLNADQ